MTTTLRIANKTGGELTIETGGVPIKLAAAAEADLGEKELKSPGLAKALEAGSVSFVKVAKPASDQIALARSVLGGVIKTTGGQLDTFKGRFDQSQKELLKLREGFNKAWKVAEANLAGLQERGDKWSKLRIAIKELLPVIKIENPEVTKKTDEVEAIKKKIETLKKEDLTLPASRKLDAWLADLQKVVKALEEAQAALEKLRTPKADSVEKGLEDGDAAVVPVAGLKKDKAIGTEIAEFGK